MQYIVKAGDTLSKIAVTYTIGGTDYVQAIANYNNIADPNMIYVGQSIMIPDTWLQAQYAPAPSQNVPTGGLVPTGGTLPTYTASTPLPSTTAAAGGTILGMQPKTLIMIGIAVVGMALVMGMKKG